MSFGASDSSTDSSANQTTTQDPYAAAVPSIKDFITQLTANSSATPPVAATDAIGQLITQAQGGNPFGAAVAAATSGALGATTQPQQDQANAGFQQYSNLMTPVANSATSQNVLDNPQVKALVDATNADATNSINQSFAASGRSGSGMAQEAVARGIASGEAPILLNQYNADASRADTAAGNLYAAGNTTANTTAGLQGQQAAIQSQGVAEEPAALTAAQWGPTQVAQLSTALKDLPLDQLSQIANLLFPAASLGGTTSSNKTANSDTTGFNVGFKL